MIAFITVTALGILVCILGAINMTGNISSLHSYHRHRVSEADRKPYGKLIGIGTTIIGAAMIIFGVLFFMQLMQMVPKLRDMDADFGILPYPKLDEAQAQYSSTSRDNFDLFVVPIDVKDTEFTGIITEALCAESYRSVVPKYYDVVLKSKTSRDEESAEMIDIIRDNLTFDIGYLCSSSLSGIGHIFVGLIRSNSNDLVSKFAAVEKPAGKLLEKMLVSYGIE